MYIFLYSNYNLRSLIFSLKLKILITKLSVYNELALNPQKMFKNSKTVKTQPDFHPHLKNPTLKKKKGEQH